MGLNGDKTNQQHEMKPIPQSDLKHLPETMVEQGMKPHTWDYVGGVYNEGEWIGNIRKLLYFTRRNSSQTCCVARKC